MPEMEWSRRKCQYNSTWHILTVATVSWPLTCKQIQMSKEQIQSFTIESSHTPCKSFKIHPHFLIKLHRHSGVFAEQIFSTNTVKATLTVIPAWGTSLKLRIIVKGVCVKMKQNRILLLCLQNHSIYFTFIQLMFPINPF